MSFKDIALPMIARGIPVIPLRPKSKIAFLSGWEDLATTDQEQIEKWYQQYPDANCASVAKAQIGLVWFLELDRPEAGQRIESETGKRVPDTFRVRSREGRRHLYWKQTPASLAMGNLSQANVVGEDWSARVDNEYVVAPGSIHPDSGQPYLPLNNNEIIEAPDWLIDWCVSQKKNSQKETASAATNEPIKVGSRNATLASRLGKVHHNAGGLSKETLLMVARDINQYCETPLDDSELETIAGSIARYPVQVDEFAERMELKAHRHEIQWVREPAAEQTHEPTVAIPTSALASTRLQDIYSEIFQPNGWTLDFALPALITAASAIVPRFVIPETQVIQGDDNMVNLYTALIGEPHCGKSQAMEWAAKAMGIWSQDCGKHFLEIKAGSAEQLIDSIDRRKNHLENSVLVLQDEWSHLFAKATIPNASFPSFMTSSYYKKRQIFPRPKGKEVVLNLALSFVGGIVEDDFDSVFNASTLGGCYDRFLFGYVPRTWKWDYRPYPYALNEMPSPVFGEMWNPIPVTLNGSVFEVIRDWNRKNPDLGRIVEICTRIATIYASMDGRAVVTGKDLEDLWGLAQYQLDVRGQFQPNAGVNPDAQFANAAVRWIEKYAGDWVSIADLKTGVHAYEMKLGPNVAERALYALARGGRIQLWINTHNFEKNPMPTDYEGAVPRLGLVRRVLK